MKPAAPPIQSDPALRGMVAAIADGTLNQSNFGMIGMSQEHFDIVSRIAALSAPSGNDECCFDTDAILADIPGSIASGALTSDNALRIGMSREQFAIAASMSPSASFDAGDGCCLDIAAILADIPGAIEAGVLTANNSHIIGVSRGGFALIQALIQWGGGGGVSEFELTPDQNFVILPIQGGTFAIVPYTPYP